MSLVGRDVELARIQRLLTNARDGRSGGLHPPSTATTVDYSGDSPVLTPGPFVEAKEYLGGFWIIEAENDDVAIEWAKQASRALRSRVEVRALQEAPQG
ncbi:YciI family protein [Kibdelosporangium persicum]|uniref:Dehydrogenase n=1 Tax=Kibdelosporangium persicum TaxID=2698649 RepID=A0ABX2F5E2_9PSEU|nr:YciI family protein [Kibdelosporangium persicum]NRN66472.1 Dehydrogenase [Kibdelosporangium persicum]